MSAAWGRAGGAARGLLILTLVAVLTACTAVYRNHGWVPSDDDLSQITVGKDTRETVRTVIGDPGTAGMLSDSAWYYVQSRFEHYAYREPREIDRQVVAISFTPGGTVENIERFGLEKGRVVVLSRRVTDSNIKGVSFLRQLFGSFGNFTADQLLAR